MLYKVIDRRAKRDITLLELDGKEDFFNVEFTFPLDKFMIVPVSRATPALPWGVAA